MDISEEILKWREGDPITPQHRQALAAHVARGLNLSKEKEAETLEDINKIPDEQLPESLAVMIATITNMDMQSFLLAFPKIAMESKNEAVEYFLKTAFPES